MPDYLRPPSTLPTGSLVDSYRRDSGGMRQDKSTDQQLAEIEAYCQQHNLVHRHRFVDEAKSGKSTAGRDDFNQMLSLYADQPDQRPRGLLLWNYARFARDIDDAQFNKIRIRQWGIAIHSLNDSIPEGEHGRIIEFLIDVANEEKRKQTSADAKRGLKELVEKYRCVPGPAPRGFKLEPVFLGLRRDKTEHIAHRRVPDPELIPKVRKAFEMKAAGHTLPQIHAETHLFGSLNSYKTFFENPIYIGTLKFGELLIPKFCEPMIDLQTWDAVQRKLQANIQHGHLHSANHPRRQSGSYLLSGLIYCARCHSPLWGMTAKQRNGTYHYRYACTRAKRNRDCGFQPIPAPALEKHVLEALQEFVKEPNNLAELLEADRQELDAVVAQSQTQIIQKQKELTAVRRKIRNTAEAIAEHKSDVLMKQLKEFEAEEVKLQTKIFQLKNATPQTDPPLTPEEILVLTQSLVRRLQGKDSAEIRLGLHALIKRILVDRRDSLVQGVITFKKRSREPQDDEDSHAIIITASTTPDPLGPPTYRRSIYFTFALAPRKRPRH